MNNILFCITGPSGSGKTTVMRSVMSNELLSFTTRDMREGEVNGVDYAFHDRIEFDWMLENGMLVEFTEYPPESGNFYGLTLEELVTKLRKDHAFFICDNNGLKQVKEKYTNIVSIFLYADEDDCAKNMFTRGDSSEKIDSRLVTYNNEMANVYQYDYVVKNVRGQIADTLEAIKKIISYEIHRVEDDAE